MDDAFRDAMTAGYALTEPGLILGSPMLGGELRPTSGSRSRCRCSTGTGSIAGATGTGKTKTLQLLAGQLSKAGVPVFVADIKGDLTGLAAPGDATQPEGHRPRHLARLDVHADGPPGRVPVAVGQARRPGPGDASTRFGPLLLGKVLDLNETQTVDPVAGLQVLRRQRRCRCSTWPT